MRIERGNAPQRGIPRLEVQRIRPPRSPITTSLFDGPGLFLSARLDVIEMVEAQGLRGRVERFERPTLPRRFAAGEILLALDQSSGKEYLVLQEGFEAHKLQIYHHEALSALRIIEAKHPPSQIEKTIFNNAEKLMMRVHGSGGNLRHVSFMLKQAAETGADYLTAAAILVHNLPDAQIRANLLTAKKTKGARLTVNAILTIKELFGRLDGTKYLPPPPEGMPPNYTEDSMHGMIKIAGGKGPALLLYLLHQFSSFMRSRKVDPHTVRKVIELLAPLAEKFGQIDLGAKLRNEAFRLGDTEEYNRIEGELARRAKMSREEAGLLLDKVEENLAGLLSPHGLVLAKTRYKNPWEAQQKTLRKPEDYPEVSFLEDILGAMGVTENGITLKAAIEIASQAVGNDFLEVNYEKNATNNICKTATRRHQVGEQTCTAHHVSIKLKDGNIMEFQIMDRNSYEIRERGARAHYKYLLEEMLGQKFDEELLERCRPKMTGDFNHDVKVVYEELHPWVVVYAQDQRFIEETHSVLRRKAGSLPLDAVPLIGGKDISAYSGVKKRRVWEKRLDAVREEKLLEDGDYLELNRAISSSYLSPALRSRLISLVKHVLTKFLLAFFDKEEEAIAEAVAAGRQQLALAAQRKELKFNQQALIEFARTKNMQPAQIFACVQAKILSTDEVLEALAPK